MIEELRQMYTGETKSFNIFEHNHSRVKRVSPYTWEWYYHTEHRSVDVYIDSFGYERLGELVKGLGGE